MSPSSSNILDLVISRYNHLLPAHGALRLVVTGMHGAECDLRGLSYVPTKPQYYRMNIVLRDDAKVYATLYLSFFPGSCSTLLMDHFYDGEGLEALLNALMTAFDGRAFLYIGLSNSVGVGGEKHPVLEKFGTVIATYSNPYPGHSGVLPLWLLTNKPSIIVKEDK